MDAMGRLADEHVISRLAERDASLFADNARESESVAARMGWIGLATRAVEHVPLYRSIAEEIVAEAATDVVLLGMGGSSLSSLVFADVFGSAKRRPALHVLDTTSPATVAGLRDRLDPETTWFLVSSKSGTTIEPLSLYAVFRAWVDECLGGPAAGSRFVAITDPGTPLEEMRRTENMRTALSAPPDVGGRFSALTAFGLMPATLVGIDVPRLLAHASGMDRTCRTPGEGNPAASLATWIADAHATGRNKLTIATSTRYESFALWVEQLIAESTGKRGTGIVPVPETAMRTPTGFGQDRAVVVMGGVEEDELGVWAETVRGEGHPVYRIELGDALDIGAEFVRWEYATAMLGFLLGVNPFDEPDVGAAKSATLDVLAGADVLPATREVDRIRLTYAGSLAAPDSQAGDLTAGIRPALDALRPGDYLALLAYLPYDQDRLGPVRAAASNVAAARGVAVCLELGPRYLHSTGQLHKGGPDQGVFVVITARDAEDLGIPGRDFSLARLHRAQADGDLATLASRGRRVMRVDLPDSRPASLLTLADALVDAARG